MNIFVFSVTSSIRHIITPRLAARAADTRQALASNATSATSAQDDDDWDLQPEGAQPLRSNILSRFGRSVHSQVNYTRGNLKIPTSELLQFIRLLVGQTVEVAT